MSFPNRVVLYLKPPMGGAPAEATAKSYAATNQTTTEADIRATGLGIVTLNTGKPFRFNLRTLGGTRAFVEGPPVDWPGGCRAYVSIILGEGGDNEIATTGLDYTTAGPVSPCTELICSFDDAGILTMEDNRGVKITMDVKLPGAAPLCLTLVPAGHKARAEVYFPAGPFATIPCQH